jgi:ribulose-phosphate 3-epimerase
MQGQGLPRPVLTARSTTLIELAPSILSADFSQLGAQAQAAVDGGGTLLHIDVMDGHFVPNITIGPLVVSSLRKAVPDVPFDCHLMIENPDDYIPAFAEAGANWISVHQEACVHLNRTLHLIASHGCKPAVVINPATPVHALDEVLDIVHHVLVMSVNPGFGAQKFIPGSLRKIETLARIRESRGLSFRIEVDGGVDLTTVADVVRAGAELLVAGNAVFSHGDIRDNAKKLLQTARAATMARA